MHTHFASATHTVGTFLAVVLVGTLWRLVAMHGMLARSPFVRGVARVMLFQY